MARIGKREAARILRRVVAKHGPDTRYRDRDRTNYVTCKYVNSDGAPLCIVGVALVEELGVDPALLMVAKSFRLDDTYGLYNEVPQLQEIITPAAAAVFQRAQTEQDFDATWGAAVERATDGVR